MGSSDGEGVGGGGLGFEGLFEAGEEVFVALAAFGEEGFLFDFKVFDAVGAEAAEVVAEFAPGDQGPDIAPEEQGHRAKGSIGDAPGGVAIADLDEAALFDGAAEDFEGGADRVGGGGVEGGRVHGDGVDAIAEFWSQNGFDFAQGVVGGGGEFGVSPGDDHAAAEDESGDFAAVKHKWGQVVIAAEGVADSGFALDGDAGELEILDVAVDGAVGDRQFFGQAARGLETARAQELDDSEETVGSAHRRNVQG